MTEAWSISTLRHGETDFNRERRYAGTLDIELNENGRRDASKIAPRVREMGFEVIITSPYKRALETARLLIDGSTEILTSSLAHERDFGVLQGLTSMEIEAFRPPIRFIKMGGDFHSLDPPGGETFEQLRARVERFYNHLLDNHFGKRILVVSHSVFLQQLHGMLRGQDWITALERSVGNLELTTFHFHGYRVVSEGSTHLSDRPQSEF